MIILLAPVRRYRSRSADNNGDFRKSASYEGELSVISERSSEESEDESDSDTLVTAHENLSDGKYKTNNHWHHTNNVKKTISHEAFQDSSRFKVGRNSEMSQSVPKPKLYFPNFEG